MIRKCLSYREHKLLDRPLVDDEAGEVMNIARPIAAMLLLEPSLDANYQVIKSGTFPVIARRGFRVTDADGNATDFYVEPATGRVKSFLIPYNGRTFGTENDKMKEVEGVLIPFKFTMRLATVQGVYFAEYSVKDVKLNQQLGDDVFEIPN